MTKMQTIEQQRSEFALKKVLDIKDKEFGEEYKSLVKDLPIMILKNGLIQTIAFMESKAKIGDPKKGKQHYQVLLKHLEEYLKVVYPLSYERGNAKTFSQKLSTISTTEYRNITVEFLAFAKWLKRYVEALIKEKQGEIKGEQRI